MKSPVTIDAIETHIIMTNVPNMWYSNFTVTLDKWSHLCTSNGKKRRRFLEEGGSKVFYLPRILFHFLFTIRTYWFKMKSNAGSMFFNIVKTSNSMLWNFFLTAECYKLLTSSISTSRYIISLIFCADKTKYQYSPN